MRVPALSVAAVMAALVLAGCGPADNADDFTGTQQDVAQAVDDLVDAAQRGDESEICDSLMTADLRRQIAASAVKARRGPDCKDGLEDSLRDASAFEVDVESIRVTGRTAAVRVKTKVQGADPVDALRLVNERGWRLAALPRR